MTPSNDNRPAEFDAKLVAYMPGLRALAGRKYRLHEPDDLANSTLVWALENWHKHRGGDSVFPWLKGVMANIATKRIITMDLERQSTIHIESDSATPAQQEHVVEIKQVMSLLDARDHAVIAMVAVGATLQDIGASEGVSIERARQLVGRARKRLCERLVPPLLLAA